ncbi:hypothetical protein TARUN_676 [Trichoderma arundinaceum]|uniref:Uncharacterized protein n=1 Tax=Trichoderma arundinaceum TaxID=490622 RepID=A0A395P0F5_TRIAR|nr:hypothetical protein TARUN_676 [Trichoderma arundinaceum]
MAETNRGTKDPFAAIPLELCGLILEGLPRIRDVQSAILTCRSLLSAYEVSRRRILQAVFQNEYGEIVVAANCAKIRYRDESPLAQASRRVNRIARMSPSTSFILREALWSTIVAQQQAFNDAFENILISQWSLALAKAYRGSKHERKAREIETQTMQVLFMNGPKNPKRHNWLSSTAAVCAQNGSHQHMARLIHKVWGTLDDPQCNNAVASESIKAISQLCQGNISSAAMPLLEVVTAEAWVYLTMRELTHPDMLCDYCLGNVNYLAQVAGKGFGIAEFERAWQQLTPRKPAFRAWTPKFLKSHADQLDGLQKIWARLRTVPPTSVQMENCDASWARRLIRALRRRGDTRQQALEFEEYVFTLLEPGQYSYKDFGERLANHYVGAGNYTEAIRVREQMKQNLDPSSPAYILAEIAIARLYEDHMNNGVWDSSWSTVQMASLPSIIEAIWKDLNYQS